MVKRGSGVIRRVDVFSPSGGVGKTLLTIRLAQLQAQRAHAPVLLVDADISGPCLGDLLESWASPPWDSTTNLLHLICGRPEYLPDQLRPGKLPVYRMRDECPADVEKRAPEIVTEAIRGEPAVIFCPSHPHSTNPRVELPVLHALLGHESAGGWIGHLLHEVIRETNRLMDGCLGGVIVDHGPAMGALQSATLRECGMRSCNDDENVEHRALLVTALRAADLAAARDLAGRMSAFLSDPDHGAMAADAMDRVTWIVNRIPPSVNDWKESIRSRYPRNDGWLEKALPVRADPAMADSHAEADLSRERHAAIDADLERICERIFG
jgi:hypothetical protein